MFRATRVFMASSGADHAVAGNSLRSAEDIYNSIPAPCLSILRDICLHKYFLRAAWPKTEEVNTVAKGLNEMDTKANFSGTGSFKVVIQKGLAANGSNDAVNLDDEYIGKYSITRNVVISGVAKFDEPHISISKVGKMDPASGTFVNYVITTTNDGNKALGPIYVTDIFPPGTNYVYSSLKPSNLTSSYAQWPLTNLGIGQSTQIDLKLNTTYDTNNLVNRVRARGDYGNQWVSAENFSAIGLNWLPCSPTQVFVAKTAYVDTKDPMVVHYSIILSNREKYAMVASITDQMPEGLNFLNSSLQPSDHLYGKVSWNIIDLKPGETRSINYLVKALHSGNFVNQAHIEVTSVNGPDSASTDVESSVYVSGEGAAYPSPISNWQPPACFGLNCTQTGSNDDYAPCESCGAKEPQPIVPVCASCVSEDSSNSDTP
jgi:large repetitive protein